MSKSFKIFIFLIISIVQTANATNYYVDNINGNDNYNGLTQSTAWQSLLKVNSSNYLSGDSVLFKRGGIWRGQLIPKSGTFSGNITYANYGTGPKPLILGSVNVSNASDWVSEGGNIWHSSQSSNIDIGNLIFNDATSFGFKKWTASQLLTQGDFWWDKNNTKTVKIYSTINPALFYTEIEAAIGTFIVYIQQGSYIVLKNLAFKYGAADGIEVRNSHHIIIRDCELSYIGGCELTTQVRYGGGIQFWANSNNNTVERCKIWEIYDDAITNQGNVSAGGTVLQYNLFYRNNIIWNCSESSVCFFIQPSVVAGSFMKNIYFENNTCANAGGGWAASQRPDMKGFHVYCSENTAATDSIFIRNNIFYKSRCVLFFDNNSVHTLSYTNMNYNCWYTQNTTDTIVAFWTSNSLNVWTTPQFANYQSVNNQDHHSFLANPLFVNATNYDFHLTAESPCLDAGINSYINTDFDLNPRPQNGIYDIGAYEYFSGTNTLNNKNNDFYISVYPNPANDLITVNTTYLSREYQLSIYNIQGQAILKHQINESKFNVDISTFPSGIYLVKIISDKIYYTKIVVQ